MLKACTKVPLYNTCVTKINKHCPPPPCLFLKRTLCKAWLSCLSAPCVPSLQLLSPPSLTLAQHRKPPPPTPLRPPHRKLCCPCGLGGPRRYQLWKYCLPLTFYFNLQLSGLRPKERMHKLHVAKVLSGKGWADPFTRNAHDPEAAPSGRRGSGEAGLLLVQDCVLYTFCSEWYTDLCKRSPFPRTQTDFIKRAFLWKRRMFPSLSYVL